MRIRNVTEVVVHKGPAKVNEIMIHRSKGHNIRMILDREATNDLVGALLEDGYEVDPLTEDRYVLKKS